MEVNELTLHACLKHCRPESAGYQIMIFEDLEFKDPDFKYITCVMFPNWDQGPIKIGEEGYLQVRYIAAGKDTWFDGKDFVPYKYSNVQFLKFVRITNTDNNLVLD